jgi:hypothetical protein
MRTDSAECFVIHIVLSLQYICIQAMHVCVLLLLRKLRNKILQKIQDPCIYLQSKNVSSQSSKFNFDLLLESKANQEWKATD